MKSIPKQLLNVGCGPRGQHHRVPGFAGWQETRLDPDVVGSMTDMSALASASMDAIVSSHNIEHLSPHQVPLALAEFRRVLKEDGIVVITCPDLQSVAARVAVGELVTPLYQSPAGKDYMAHRCGFTLQVLIDTLHAAGFPRATGMARAETFDLWVLASKHYCSDEKLLAMATDRHFNRINPSMQRNG